MIKLKYLTTDHERDPFKALTWLGGIVYTSHQSTGSTPIHQSNNSFINPTELIILQLADKSYVK